MDSIIKRWEKDGRNGKTVETVAYTAKTKKNDFKKVAVF